MITEWVWGFLWGITVTPFATYFLMGITHFFDKQVKRG